MSTCASAIAVVVIDAVQEHFSCCMMNHQEEEIMVDFEEDLRTLQKMEIGSNVFLAMFQDGGAEVRRTDDGWLLYEIPLYGGDPWFQGTFHSETLTDLLHIVNSWT